jgi:hypothetical protein
MKTAKLERHAEAIVQVAEGNILLVAATPSLEHSLMFVSDYLDHHSLLILEIRC